LFVENFAKKSCESYSFQKNAGFVNRTASTPEISIFVALYAAKKSTIPLSRKKNAEDTLSRTKGQGRSGFS
jgi:hypothetical protein